MALKKIILTSVIAVICGLSVLAQDRNTTIENDSLQAIIYEETSDYIQIYKNRITAKLYYVDTSNSLMVQDRNSNFYVNLVPNKQNRIGASVAFRSIAISYAFAPNFLAKNKDNEDSKLFNLNFRTYFGKHWMQTLDFYNQKGFYIENKDASIYLPKTKSFKVGGSTSYIFNENFSFRAIATQDEKQLKSAGSFIPGIVYYYSKMDLVAEDPDPEFNLHSDLTTFDIALAPAYYYNFVPTKNLFLSLGVSAGIGLNYSESKDDVEHERLTSLLTEIDFRGAITYDIDNLYLGANYNYLILNHNSDRSSYVKDNIPFFQAYIGYRFKAPRKIVHTANDINDKIIPKSKD
ncbi:conserved hypothetical protein (DUF4421) [Formosa agariphila KMM 3901]|uniref:DUF4421 domain-containing protein n=1 Tax=Formosa agariphila (strain DSM 15362 / KCTC 12365 / LMG 23005 / KMM 3901 / M-2Alg 35-1) TaxID=1347342 RepID=T2KRJ9_FORAG|nr:DUF4421 domain-containing protein [Formosa agariphila]CDF81143.1 conserved hypothetical protein (DUF4421) [Formosa agariphila KMM 3901]